MYPAVQNSAKHMRSSFIETGGHEEHGFHVLRRWIRLVGNKNYRHAGGKTSFRTSD